MGCGVHVDAEDPDAAGASDAVVGAGALSVGTEVTSDMGVVQGQREEGLVVFRGIPYAAPPTGAQRLRPPAPPVPWEGVRDALAFGPACPQPGHEELPQSEDCLTLNIWAHPEGGPRPVMVWIHGGGFVEGSSRIPHYDGAALARAGEVVVVSINYRLGALGFLSSAELVSEQGTAGNWGYRDQIAALEWVRRNAGAFGGDPARVTIFGESAGGASVCALQTGATFATKLGCDAMPAERLACLRSKSVAEILAAQVQLPSISSPWFPLTPLLPVIDGAVLDALPIDAIANGRGDVPTIVGGNDHETSAFLAAAFPENDAFYRALLDGQLGAAGDDVYALYDPATYGSVEAAAVAFTTDRTFLCPGEALAHAASSGAPAFLYRLSRAFPSGALAGLGAAHGVDVFYLFETFATIGYTPEAGDEVLVAAVQAAWSSLARGTSSPTFTPSWPGYQRGAPQVALLDLTRTVETGWRSGRCAQLRALGAVR